MNTNKMESNCNETEQSQSPNSNTTRTTIYHEAPPLNKATYNYKANCKIDIYVFCI